MDALGPWHLLIIAGVFVVLFGAKKLPDAARSLGKSARILKTELKGLHDDDDPAAKQIAELQATAVVPAPAPAAAPVAPPAPAVAVPVAPPVPVSDAPAQSFTLGDQPPTS
jgi:sec-independent protein translocase protein TatA